MAIADFRGSGFSGTRDPDRDTADVVGIQLALSGSEPLAYGQDDFVLDSGNLFVWSSGLGRFFDSVDEHREITVVVPRSSIPWALDTWIRTSHPLGTTPGAGLLSIAADQMRAIARELDSLSDRSLSLSVELLLDTLGATVQPVQGSDRSDRGSLFNQVQHYLGEHLADPGLVVRTIARAHGISVRTLHTVFAEGGTSVARFVRRQRLEQARRELARSPLGTTVTDIAFRWGFVDAGHFSRTFKQEFGVTPSSVLAQGLA